MKSKTPLQTSSTPVLQTLAWVRKMGFRPVPLQPGTKAAAVRDYVSPEYKPPSDDHWHTRHLDIGVVLGPKLNGPVDIDLDCDETVMLASKFLPPTKAVFGRPGKPRSHFIYRVKDDELPKIAYHDPLTRKCLVELRADGGHQTVFPGSIHEGTGELIEWSDVPFPDLVELAAETLELSVRRLAVAALVARYLWDPGTRNENVKHLCGMFYYMKWTEEETENLISSVMEYHGDEDKTRLKTLRLTYKRAEKGAKVTGATTLKKVIPADRHPVVDKILEWIGAAENSVLMDYNERFAVVRMGSTFRVADLDVSSGTNIEFMTKDTFHDFYSNERIVMADGKKIPKTKLWLANEQRRTYKNVDFLPGVEDPPDVLNMWTGWAVKPDPKGSCKQWLKLLKEVVCGGNETLYDWMLHWFANVVREPMDKALTAPVIIGKPGAGKSVLVDYFGKILGSNYTVVSNREQVHGKFNSHMGTTLLLHSAEALYGGERQHRNIIKSLITDNWRMHEQKGIDARPVKNYLRLILTSNEAVAAPVEVNDRRYTVISLGDRKISKKHIAALLEEMSGSGPAALLHFLQTMKYDPFVPRTNMKTRDHAAIQQRNLDPLESWWMETLDGGSLLPSFLLWAQRETKDEWPHTVASPVLYKAMTQYVKGTSSWRHMPNPIEFAEQMREFLGVPLRKKQVWYVVPEDLHLPPAYQGMSSRMNSYHQFPALEDCRKAFEKYLGGQKIKWVTEKEELPFGKDKPKGKPY